MSIMRKLLLSLIRIIPSATLLPVYGIHEFLEAVRHIYGDRKPLTEGVATKKIKGKYHKNHKRSESSRKNQPVGEKNQNQNQLGISTENLPMGI